MTWRAWARAAADSHVCADVGCSCDRRRPCRYPRSRAKLVSLGHTAAGGSGDIQTQLLLKPMLGSMVLLRWGFNLKSGSYTATKSHVEAPGLGLQPEALVVSSDHMAAGNHFHLGNHSLHAESGWHPGLSRGQGPGMRSWFSRSWGLC